jgi:hypothetical protein
MAAAAIDAFSGLARTSTRRQREVLRMIRKALEAQP